MLENLSYKNKIILFIAIVFFLISASLVFIYAISKDNLIAGHNNRLETTAQLTTNLLNRDVEGVEKVISLFEENKTLTEYLYITNRMGQDKEPLEELSKNIINPLNFSLLVLYDINGEELVRVDTDYPEDRKGPPEKLTFMKDKKNISGFAINNGILRILALGTMTFKPSPYEQEDISYIKIGANIDTKYLNFIKKISGNDIFVMKGSDIQLSTQEGVSSVDISGQTMEAGGNRYSIKSIPLGSIYGEEIGTLIIALSQKDLAAALKKLRFTIILLALGSILIAGLLGLALTKTLTSPLNKLVRLTEQVGSGRFPEETSFSGSDEVSVLGRHFLEMTKKLKDQKKALASYTTGLEDAVMKRTRELFNSREEWISTFNAIKDYILIVDRDYSIVRANKTLLDRIALTNQELSGKKCYEVLCGEKGAPDACPIKTTLETKEPSFTEIRYYKLGEYFMASAAPLSIKGNIITNIVYVVKDITERHNMQLQMINAEKLASMGQMAAGFAHEINNPMAAIAGCTELLIDQLDSNELKNIPQFEYFHDYLNIIYREAFRCKDIIRGMLRFSRRQFEKSTVEVDLIIREILSLLDHIIKHQRINVVEEYKNTDNSLHADEGEIRQIFLALVVNAIDAMPEGGTLTIKTMESVEGIRVTVHDTGPGIPRDVQNRIFEPFFTTKPVGKGTGLGLFIAFNMVKKYHGKLELESTNGQGSIFSVSLPVINTAEEPEEG